MPKLTVLAVRLALINLTTGFGLGALLLISKATGWIPRVWVYLPVHMDMLAIGWMAQLAVGVAFWILPRYRGGHRPHPEFAWIAIVALNAGLGLVAASAVLGDQPQLAVLGRISQAAGMAAFAVHAWPRVKAPGSG